MEMVSNNYKKSFVEVQAVLNCLDIDDYKKVPIDIINALEENKDKNYKYDYDESLEYNSWNLMAETKAILYNLYKNYLATEEQRKVLIEKEKNELYKIEEAKKKKYSTEIFNDKNEISSNILIKNKEEILLKKIINKILSFFKKENW